MLRSIYIENILLIDKVAINFESGFSVITGQTGAGKSIIFDAISLVLGERLKQKVVPNGKTGTIVASFDITGNDLVIESLAENGIQAPPDNLLILRRSITDFGLSKMYICDVPCSASFVSTISDLLIEIYSQTGSLRNKNSISWMKILDRYIDNKALLNEIQSLYTRRQEVLAQASKLQAEQKTLESNRVYLERIIKDIENLGLKENEEQELNDLKNSNKASLEASKYFAQALEIIDANKITTSLNKLELTLQKIDSSSSSAFDLRVQDLQKMCEKARADLELAREEIEGIVQENSSNMEQADKIEERLYEIKAIAKKHNLLPGELKQTLDEAKLEIAKSSSINTDLDLLLEDEKRLRANIISIGKEISLKRHSAADIFVEAINKQLEELMLPKARLKISIETSEEFISASGIDRVRFLASLNPGVPMDDVEKIASGGEFSRLMLAILVVTATERKRCSLLFDEIDTGISGSVAAAVGRKMNKIGDSCQVISITHSHQVAARAKNHLRVSKSSMANSAAICIENLTKEERINTLAEMMNNGDSENSSLKEVAKKMIEDSF